MKANITLALYTCTYWVWFIAEAIAYCIC